MHAVKGKTVLKGEVTKLKAQACVTIRQVSNGMFLVDDALCPVATPGNEVTITPLVPGREMVMFHTSVDTLPWPEAVELERENIPQDESPESGY